MLCFCFVPPLHRLPIHNIEYTFLATIFLQVGRRPSTLWPVSPYCPIPGSGLATRQQCRCPGTYVRPRVTQPQDEGWRTGASSRPHLVLIRFHPGISWANGFLNIPQDLKTFWNRHSIVLKEPVRAIRNYLSQGTFLRRVSPSFQNDDWLSRLICWCLHREDSRVLILPLSTWKRRTALLILLRCYELISYNLS